MSSQATWTVVMCLARLSMALISHKYAVPGNNVQVCRSSLSPLPTILPSPLNSSFPPYVALTPYFQIFQLPTNFR
jgi:hypothetical protein